MKKILFIFLMVGTFYIIHDWFSIGNSVVCMTMCVDGDKIMVCRHNYPSSQNSPTILNIGVCK